MNAEREPTPAGEVSDTGTTRPERSPHERSTAASGPIVTALYVPGDRPDRFDKAAASGAQLVIVDLEDAVAPDRKALARDEAVRWAGARSSMSPMIDIRVNAGDADDLAAVAALDPLVGVRVPKVESPSQLDDVIAVIGASRRIDALVESAVGVEAIAEIAGHPGLDSLSLGEADLASDLATSDPAVLDWVRVRLLVASRAAGLGAPMMSVYPSIADLDGLRVDTERGRARGFVGRTAVHPSQLQVIAAAFRPTAEEMAWAHEVIATLDGGGVSRLASGEMVDAAMRGRAEQIIALDAVTRSGTSS